MIATRCDATVLLQWTLLCHVHLIQVNFLCHLQGHHEDRRFKDVHERENYRHSIDRCENDITHHPMRESKVRLNFDQFKSPMHHYRSHIISQMCLLLVC